METSRLIRLSENIKMLHNNSAMLIQNLHCMATRLEILENETAKLKNNLKNLREVVVT